MLLKQIETIGDVIEMTTLAENLQKTQKDYKSAEPWLQMMPQKQLNYYKRPLQSRNTLMATEQNSPTGGQICDFT
jgi:hypothetical protein